MMKAKGTVYLVGAGPGDAGLLTLRGADLLRRADVVIYDGRVNPQLLELAPADAERVCRETASSPKSGPPAPLSALMVERARAGQVVVRLKAGDPYDAGLGRDE